MIAKVATAQDDITGDGTTSNVLIIGELLKQADLYISEVTMGRYPLKIDNKCGFKKKLLEEQEN